MAKMADKNKNVGEEMKLVRVLNYNADNKQDEDLLAKANEVGRLPQYKGMPLSAVVRNIMESTFDRIIENANNNRLKPAG